MILLELLGDLFGKRGGLRDPCRYTELVDGDFRVLEELVSVHILDAMSCLQIVPSLLSVLIWGALDTPHVGVDSQVPILGQLVAVGSLLKQVLRIVHPVRLGRSQVLKEAAYSSLNTSSSLPLSFFSACA